ncbi:MAG: hypothetical protein DMF57_07155 [Acidobacteria bacterium]|nr:MAG: hypothetical protein DMF57_07155 [Acidobacteriota bacterium]
MRNTFVLLTVSLALALPAAAQNTDIESLSGLQFNFGNPGARSLGMGGAFLGLADDASAAEANPAGLTILRKPEISLEGRNYLEQQLFTTSGTFPDLKRTAFTHYSRRAELTFGSFVYPVKNFTFGVYYHQPLKNEGSGRAGTQPIHRRRHHRRAEFFSAQERPSPGEFGGVRTTETERPFRVRGVHDPAVHQRAHHPGAHVWNCRCVQDRQLLVWSDGAISALQRDRLHVSRDADVRLLQHLRASHQ